MTLKRLEPLENMRVVTRVLDQSMVVQLASPDQINALDVEERKANGQVPGRDLGPILVLDVALETARVGAVLLGRLVAVVLEGAHVRQPAVLLVVVLAVLPDHLEDLVSLRGHLDGRAGVPSLDRGLLEVQGESGSSVTLRLGRLSFPNNEQAPMPSRLGGLC